MVLKDKEVITYSGGAAVSAALVSAVGSLIKTLYSIGQNIGSALYRFFRKQSC